jgi:hypothetical protein
LYRLTGRSAGSWLTDGGSPKKKGEPGSPLLLIVAERTGLEPATPGVTGRYSNQLNYRSKKMVGAESLELPTFAL